MQPGAPILHPELIPGTNRSFQWGFEDGNVEAGFREADHIIEYDRAYHGLNNHKPNPYAVVAWWEQDPLGTEGKTLYIEGNQHNFVLRQIRDIFKLPEDKVRWLTVYDGGQYCDFNPRRLSILAPLLAKRTGRPVRIAFTRRDNFDVGGGDQTYTHAKIGFKNDGIVTAAYGEDVANGGVLALQEKGKTWDGYVPFSDFCFQNDPLCQHQSCRQSGVYQYNDLFPLPHGNILGTYGGVL